MAVNVEHYAPIGETDGSFTVYVTGGAKDNSTDDAGAPTNLVHEFKNGGEPEGFAGTWREYPHKLNIARANHSACVIEGNLYVFGGEVDKDGNMTNSIEWTNLADEEAGFELLVLAEVVPRKFFGFNFLNREEIVIIGGVGKEG